MPVQGPPGAARIADVLRVGEALARSRPAAVGGCMIVDNTIYCFTPPEVTEWWLLLSEVRPDAPKGEELDHWLKGKVVNEETAAAAAAFYRDYLQGERLNLTAKGPAEFQNYENGMKIFREALAALDAEVATAVTWESVAAATPPHEETSSPRGGG